MKKKKGLLTIEAALVVPLVTCAIYFLILFMNIVIVYDGVQSSINNTANIIGTNSYVVSESGLSDITTPNEESGGGDFNGAKLVDVLNNIILGKEPASNLVNKFTTFDANVIIPYLNSLRTDGEYFKNYLINITNIFISLAFTDRIKGESLEATLADLTKQIGEQSLYNDLGGGLREIKHIDSRIKYLGIENGTEGFDFSETTFTATADAPEVSIVVSYEFKITNPFFEFSPIPITQRVVVRPWMGKK